MTVQTHIIGCVVRDMKAIIFVNIFLIQIKCLFYSFDVTTVFFQLYSPTPFLLSWRFVQIINAVVFLYLNELSSPNTPVCIIRKIKNGFLISQRISFYV